MKYTKKEIALDQIKGAIILFLKGGNNISVKTLVHATKNLLEDIDRNKGTNLRMESLLNKNLTKKQKQSFFNKINKFPNFCKHSNLDKKDYINSNIKIEKLNEMEIYWCINLYSILFNDKEERIMKIYFSYLIATGNYDIYFNSYINENPIEYKIIKNNQKILGLNKNHKNLKKEYYKIIKELGILND